MRNIFALTKREQRMVIAIVTLLVAASLAKHYLEIRSERQSPRSTSAVSPTATPPAQTDQAHHEDEPQEE